MRRPGLAAILAFGLAVTASPVRAQHDEADRFFQLGVDQLQAGDHPAAVASFERSYALRPRAATMCNLALTYERWAGHLREAANAYEQCALDDDTGRFRDHANEKARELRALLPPEPPPPDDNPPPDPFIGPPSGGGSSSVGGPAPPPVVVHRSHTMLYLGIGAGVLATGILVGGIVSAGKARDDEGYLARQYPSRLIPADAADDIERFHDARRRADRARILYVAAGVLGALGTTLVVIDLARPSASGPERPPPAASVGFSPLPRGGLVTAALRMP